MGVNLWLVLACFVFCFFAIESVFFIVFRVPRPTTVFVVASFVGPLQVFNCKSDEPRVPSLTRLPPPMPRLCGPVHGPVPNCARFVNNRRFIAADGGSQLGLPCVAFGTLPAEGGHARLEGYRGAPRPNGQVRSFRGTRGVFERYLSIMVPVLFFFF